MIKTTHNHLSNETSPYLLQHVNNPVDWHPWGEEALKLARESDRPILLSIGYSACHWCHVMAHESFEDEATAALMNKLYVNIKVDREERPDLDKIYQTAHQLLSRRGGGWPLTVFLDPQDQLPFFAGTYFPPEPRHGMPAFSDLLEKIREYFNQQRNELLQQNISLREAMEQVSKTEMATGDQLSNQPIQKCLEQLQNQFDKLHGGFGGAPKFPQAPVLAFLQRLEHRAPELNYVAADMLALTLENIAAGGLYDHIAGGFCRYTVDGDWTIPHFEKMLYDNAQLLSLYSGALTDTPDYLHLIQQTRNWLTAEMHSPDNGYYAALDADSEGEEGLYYVWQPAEVRSLLDEQDYDIFAARFGLDRPANFENEAWHLKIHQDLEQIGGQFGMQTTQILTSLEASIATLSGVRRKRVAPGLDDKQLTAWNALLVTGLAKLNKATGDVTAIEEASAVLDFIATQLFVDGSLFSSYSGGKARFPAYLDDYVFCLEACLELLSAEWQTRHLEFAIKLADTLLKNFEDPEGGGFFFTAHDHEQLIQRPKSMHDDAVPAGNGIAALSLLRLSHLLGEHRYHEAAERTLRAGWTEMQRAPSACCSLLSALQEWLDPGAHLVLAGAPEAVEKWRKSLPKRGVSVYAPGRDNQQLPGILAEYRNRGTVTAYLCRGRECSPPVTELSELINMLEIDTNNA